MIRRHLRCSPAVRRPVAKRIQRTGVLTQSRPDAVGQEGLNEQRETGLSGFELRRDGSPCAQALRAGRSGFAVNRFGVGARSLHIALQAALNPGTEPKGGALRLNLRARRRPQKRLICKPCAAMLPGVARQLGEHRVNSKKCLTNPVPIMRAVFPSMR